MNEFLTIHEAADELRLSLNTAYKEASIYRRTGGKRGLENFKIGGSIRVPRSALSRMSGHPVHEAQAG